ncbi:unnamed protein product [Spodoptera littoralis]|uniref:Uncharacterized protein n=1 Tax=Spodoptera littoralis TaxID=7109 RepID=A0A9P0IER9_SPOLI|nr:unnamed protein product [Spodoptera littoralis]CAH1644506.1 unnamed protein product [Spodoptera littoralis]
MDDLFSDGQTSGDKTDVMKNIRAAVEEGILAPAVMDEVMINVTPEDTKSQIMKKVRKAIEKRYVTLCVMEEVLATIKPEDNKKEIVQKLCKAVAKGQLPQSVMDDIREDVRPSDTKEDVMRKVCKAIEKKLVPQPVICKILHPNEEGFPIMYKVRHAMKKKKLTPSVMDDIVAHVGHGEKKTEVMKKIRQAVEKGHLSPSTLEVIRDIDEAKQAKDMNNVLDNLDKCRDKPAIMIHLRSAVIRGQMPQTVMNDVIKSVCSKDSKDKTIQKVQIAVRKRQLLPKVTKVIKSKNCTNQNDALIGSTVSDMKMINEAAKAHEISPSVMKIIRNEDNEIYFDTKKESPLKKIMKNDKKIIICKDDIASYLNDTSNEGEVIRRVRTAIKQGEISPSVIKMLLNKDNAGLIFSDDILCAIYPHGKNKSSVMRSKSLKTTKVSATSIVKCKHSQSERRTDYSSRKRKIKKRFSQTAPNTGKPNIMFDGMPKYTTPGITIQKKGRTKKKLNPKNDGFQIATNTNAEYRPTKPDTNHLNTNPDKHRVTKPSASKSDAITCKHEMLKPCICGSVVCKKEIEKMKLSQMKPTKNEAKSIDCTCGCKMCQEESKKILNAIEKVKKINVLKKELEILEKDKVCKSQKKIKKKIPVTEKCQTDQLKAKQKREQTVTKLEKKCADNERLRQKLTHEINKSALRQVNKCNKCKRSGSNEDDAAKICTNAITKIFKYTYNTIMNPDEFCEMMQDPCDTLNTYFNDRKAGRKKRRKKRKKKMKNKRHRTPLDFDCNPYVHMESLYTKAKTPRLSSFLFFPCILCRNWKRIYKTLLYISALIIWFPCLACFEIFRFMFYCYFGTKISGNRF